MIKIILCAFNEAQNLTSLLPDINREVTKITRDYEIIICIDGSDDSSLALIEQMKGGFEYYKESSTKNLLQKLPIKVLSPQNQLGLGLAYKRIFLDVIKNAADDDLIISLDADNTHDPAQIRDLVKLCKDHNLDLAIASRFCKTSVVTGFPLHRKFISKATSLVLQTLFPIKKVSGGRVKDYSSGYRAYLAKKLKQLYQIHQEQFVTEKDFIYTCEILLNIANSGARIDELPLIYNYGKKIGASKLKIMKNSRGLLNLIARYLMKK